MLLSVLEFSAKHIKYGLEVKSAWSETLWTKSFKATWLWVVECCSFVWIAQGIIGSLDLLEQGCVTTLVRMMLAGQLAIGTFDFIGAGVSIDT